MKNNLGQNTWQTVTFPNTKMFRCATQKSSIGKISGDLKYIKIGYKDNRMG